MLKFVVKPFRPRLGFWIPILLTQWSLLSAAQLAVSKATASTGTTATITVSLTNTGSTILGLQFDLQYDHSALTISGASAGLAATSAGKMLIGPSDEPDGSKTFGIAGINTAPIGDGSVVELSIAVSPTAPKGVYTLSMLNASGTDNNAHNVALSTIDGSITVPSGGVGSAPALGISKTHSGNFTAGQTGATYTITVGNDPSAGSSSGTVTVSEALPPGLTLVSMAGSGWTCPGTNPTNCMRSDPLAAGASYPPITVTANVATNATSPQVNSVTVSGGGSANATTTDSTVIGPSATPPVLSVSKSHNGNFTQGQLGATYSVQVGNGFVGATPSSGTVIVTETLPPGLKLVSMSGIGWTCPGTAPNNCTRNDSLPGGAGFPPIIVVVNVATDATSPQLNSVTLSGGGAASVTASDTTVIATLPPVLTITKVHNGNFTQGQTGVNFSLTVSNGSGAGSTTGAVTVTEAIPAGLTLISMAGPGWTCPGAPATSCTRSDALAAGSSYPPITVTADVAANAASPQVNTASVSGGGSATATTSDPAIVAVSVPPALSISKAHNGSFTQGQSGATYIVLVSNLPGTGPSRGLVTVTDTLPLGVALASMAGSGWTCPGTASNNCTRSDGLVGGQSYPPITVTVNVAGDAPSSVTNTATVSGGGAPDSQATDPTIIQVVGAPSVLLFPITLSPGGEAILPVSLSSVSTENVFVTLTSSDASVLSLSTATAATTANVIIPAGQKTTTLLRVVGGKAGLVTLTAAATGYLPTSIVQQVGNATGTMILSPATSSIVAPGTGNLSLTLANPATIGGLTVALSSSKGTVGTVPATVTIAENATSSFIPVSGVSAGTATITATAPGYGSSSADVVVTNPLAQIVLSSIKLKPGETATLPVLLTSPAPDSVFVTLTSSDPTIVSLSTASVSSTANVLIPAGQTTSARLSVNAGHAGLVTITATAPGYTSGSVQLMVGGPGLTLSLDFDRTGETPGTQGLAFANESSIAENSVFSSSGGVWHLDTQDLTAVSSAGYRRTAVFDSSKDVTLSTRLQVYAGTESVGFLIGDGRKNIGIRFSDSGVTLTGTEANVFVPFNTTDGLHSYVFTSPRDTGAYQLLIDGALVASGTISLSDVPGSGGSFSFGQFDGKAKVDFAYIHYAN